MLNNFVKKNLIPKLRFKEFKDHFNFKTVTLKELTKQINEKNKDKKINLVLTVSNLLGLLPQSDYYKNRTIASDDTSKYKIVFENDFVYSPPNINIGSIAVLKKISIGIVSPIYVIFRIKNNKVLLEYLNYFFETKIFNREVNKRLEGSVRHSLTYENFSKINMFIPSLEEQKKISDFLSLITKHLKIQEKIINNLKNIFSYFINNMLKLFSITKVKIFAMKKITEETRFRNKNKLLDLVLSVDKVLGLVSQSEIFKNRIIASKNKSNYKIVMKNDFAYNPARINIGSISFLKNYEQGLISPVYKSFKVNKNIVVPEFLNYYFKSSFFISEVKKRLEGSVRNSLNFNNFKTIKIKIPSISSQKDIIKFMSLFEQDLVLQEKIKYYLNNRKKYLSEFLYTK